MADHVTSELRTHGAWRLLAGSFAAAALAAAAGCTAPAPDPDPGPDPDPTPTGSTPPPMGETQETAVYFTLDTRAGFRLAREHRDVPEEDAAVAAVEAMIAGPEDPDYATTWDPGTEVLGVTQAGDVVTVDLSQDARTASVGSELAALMVQQLVYTVTSATDEDATVELLIEGEAAGDLWGAVVWDSPIGRAEPIDVMLLVQIDEPHEGATVASPVTVTGEAAVFEATLQWAVTDSAGEVVQDGFTMTSDGTTIAPFSFEVELEPGTYTIAIIEDDPSGGEAGNPMTDTRTVTVTG